MKRTILKNNESGVVLVAALMILLILSLIGVTAMQSTTLEERMAGNFAQRNLAFQAAEAGLRDAEDFLAGQSIQVLQTLPTGINGIYLPADPGDDPVWAPATWAGTNTVDIDAQTRYIIERLLPDRCEPPVDENLPKCQMVFRITSRGVGANTTAVVMLQSVYLGPLF